jgi:hypothetical protein
MQLPRGSGRRRRSEVATFQRLGVAVAFNKGTISAMSERVTKSPDPLDALRRANNLRPPKCEADLVPYNYYSSHPEHKPRPLTRRQRRRRLIREA